MTTWKLNKGGLLLRRDNMCVIRPKADDPKDTKVVCGSQVTSTLLLTWDWMGKHPLNSIGCVYRLFASRIIK